MVHNSGLLETSFFVVCDDIRIAKQPPVVVVKLTFNNEWAHEILRTSFEDLNFQFASTSIKMHYLCSETSIYVPITCVIFHHTIIDQVQIQQCFEA